MEEQKFTTNINRITAWMNENDAGAMHDVVLGMLGLPADTDAERERVWAGIRSILGILPNSPIKRGRGSNLPDEVESVIDALSLAHGEAMADAWNSGDNHLLMRKHGKSGGGLFESDEEIKETYSSKMGNDLKRRYREKIWDGTREGLESQSFPVMEDNKE
tara:strand:- start:60 stop:542 length:483 start_codon:yes stop_codon:yes gene_type:complete